MPASRIWTGNKLAGRQHCYRSATTPLASRFVVAAFTKLASWGAVNQPADV